MSRLTFHHGDNREVLRRLIDEGVRVQSVVCDPPYGLTSVTRRFGKPGAAPALPGTDGAFQRASGGFMGQQWDASGIERDPEFWRLIWEILLPGGYCLAFSSPRTGHWMAVAMEQAGFVMHPFLGWCYGSGFPKAHDAGQAIEKQLTTGAARRPDRDRGGLSRDRWSGSEEGTLFSNTGGRVEPTTDAAKQWDGWKYGAQAMKPALEPIYVAQKPFDQKNGALNILTHGVGALNIDGCRVAGEPPAPCKGTGWAAQDRKNAEFGFRPTAYYEGQDGVEYRPNEKGRHPANLLHDGSDAVREMFPAAPGQIASSSSSETRKNQNTYGEMKRGAPGSEMEPRRETDKSAARFFNAFPMTEADYDELARAGVIVDLSGAQPLFYCAKASKADRAGSKHPTVKPIALMRWLCRLVTPPGGMVLDPFAGSGTTGAAALAEGFGCILVEAHDDYAADIRRRFDLPPAAGEEIDIAALIGDPIAELIG